MKFNIVKRENKSSGWKSKTYYVRFYENGKLQYVNTKKTNKKEAEVVGSNIVSKIPKKVKVSDSSIRNLTLKQYLINNDWFSATLNPPYKEFKSGLSTHSFQERHSKLVTTALRKLFKENNDEIGDCIYYNIGKRDTDKLKKRLLKYKTTAGVKNIYILALRSVYSYLIKKDEYVKFNPFNQSKMEFFQTKLKKKYVFAPYEIYYLFNRNLLEKIEPVYCSEKSWDHFLNSDFFLAFKFAAYTGMRSNEVSALIPSQIKDERILTINRAFKDKHGTVIGLPKNSKIRTIVLCDEAYACIKEKLETRRQNEFIFQNNRKNSIYRNYQASWVKFREEVVNAFDIDLGDFKFTPHGLRKSLNTNLLKYSSIKESLIRFYCGWSDAANTLTPIQEGHYTGYDEQDLNKVAKAIQKMYVKESKKNLSEFEDNLDVVEPVSRGWTPPDEEVHKKNFIKKVYKLMGDDIEREYNEIKLSGIENLELEQTAQNKIDKIRKKENELNFSSLLLKVKTYLNNEMAVEENQSYSELLETTVELLNRKNIMNINYLVIDETEIEEILDNVIVKDLIDKFDDVYYLAEEIISKLE